MNRTNCFDENRKDAVNRRTSTQGGASRDANGTPTSKNLVVAREANGIPAGKSLVVSRESVVGPAGRVLLEGLLTTLRGEAAKEGLDLPPVEELLNVFKGPSGTGVRKLRKHNTHVAVLEGERQDIFMGLGSARKVDENGDNAFVSALIDTLNHNDYELVITTEVSRLCRNADLAGQLAQAIKRNKTIICALDEPRLDISTEAGSLRWMFYNWMAEYEARNIHRRTVLGKLAKAAAAVWATGYQPPPGWKLGEDGEVEWDGETFYAVRWLVQQIDEDPYIDFRRLTEELGNRWKLKGRRGNAAITTANRSAHVKRALLNPGWFPAYTDSVHTIRFAGEDFEGRGAAIDLPLPPNETPLATREEIRSVEEYLVRLEANAVERGSTPLAGPVGLPHGRDAHLEVARHRIRAQKVNYRILETSACACDDPSAKECGEEINVATVRKDAWHRSIAAAAIKALDDGATVRVVTALNGASRQSNTVDSVTLEADIEAKADALANYADALTRYDNPEIVADMEKLQRRTERELRRLQAELERVTGDDPAIQVEALDVSRMLEGLAGVLDVNSDAHESFREAFTVTRITDITPLTVTYEVEVRIPTEDQRIVVFGPIRSTVENLRMNPDRTEAMAALALEQGWTFEQVAAGVPGVCAGLNSPTKVAGAMAKLLASHLGRKTGSVLGGCRAPEVIAVVGHHFGYAKPPEGLEPKLVERILATYTERPVEGPKAWDRSGAYEGLHALHQHIREHGPVTVADACQVIDYADPKRAIDRWIDDQLIHRDGDRLTLPSCQCGATALAIIAAPEPDGLVCLDCRRDRTGVTFPPSWNVAIVGADHWKAAGYEIDAPPRHPDSELQEPVKLR